MAHRQFLGLEALPIFVWHLHRRVRRVVRQVGEERLVAILLHEVHRLVGEVVDYVALSPNQLAVVVQFVIEIVAPVPFRESVKLLESACVGMVWMLGAVVPLAERTGGIAGGLKCLGDRVLVGIEAFLPRGDPAHPAAGVVAPGQEFRAGRRANRVDVIVLEHRAVMRQGVNVWGRQVRVAVKAEVAPALVVGENHDNVRRTLRGLLARGAAKANEGQCGKNEGYKGRSHGSGDS